LQDSEDLQDYTDAGCSDEVGESRNLKAEIGEDPMALSMPVKNPRLHLGNSKVMGGESRVASELH